MKFSIVDHFEYKHLPLKLAETSKPFGELAKLVLERDRELMSRETLKSLDALLIAKDAAVRAVREIDKRSRDR